MGEERTARIGQRRPEFHLGILQSCTQLWLATLLSFFSAMFAYRYLVSTGRVYCFFKYYFHLILIFNFGTDLLLNDDLKVVTMMIEGSGSYCFVNFFELFILNNNVSVSSKRT